MMAARFSIALSMIAIRRSRRVFNSLASGVSSRWDVSSSMRRRFTAENVEKVVIRLDTHRVNRMPHTHV